jgi:hypothetical protein
MTSCSSPPRSFGIHLQVRQDVRDFEGMRDIGFAADAPLVFMRLFGVIVCAPDQSGIRRRIV